MYMAPELFEKGKEFDGMQADIWSTGVLFYYLCTSQFPFSAHTERDIVKKVRRGIYHIPDDLPADIKSLLQSMVLVDPTKRSSPHTLLSMVTKYRGADGSHASALVGLRCVTSDSAEKGGRDVESGHARKRFEDHVKGRVRRRLEEGPAKDAASW